eukprot:CAMPEP_0197186240 /NCGR_PEP_ID=MMETSP1423-20130617/13516_1 /TAXON_ID=476441 /ORGANISM="Pseudo-nitzschia heimii, Strain UNC1101" /LENGTH=491 /DNA_ID=CAMNT_0042637495 /DNA_START=162 /DNA_END=1637 /DNA_ORIENTATION=+
MAMLATSAVVQAKKTNDDDHASTVEDSIEKFPLPPWQRCSFFVAPTIPTEDGGSMNWGVYANRDFSAGEIVDIAPLTIPIEDGSDAIERSVLNDYVYGYWRVFEHPQMKGKHSVSRLYSVLFGPDMFYNHHPVAPNVEFVTFGREPEAVVPDAVNPQGFVANRRIRRGEEIFSSYNGKEDGGSEWFRRRGILMETPPPFAGSPLVNNVGGILDKHARDFCSKIYSGIGQPSWRDRLLPLLPKDYDLPFFIDLEWLPPSFDAGLFDARTKVSVQRGERLEISTALVLSKQFTRGTALMPLVYAWTDLHEDHRESLRELSRMEHLHLQYQGPDTSWKPINTFAKGQHKNNAFEDLVFFPVAGNIGMVRRKSSGGTEPNCRLIVHPPTKQDSKILNNNDGDNDGSMLWLEQPVGVTVELIATEDMDAGTVLVVDLVESVAKPYEYMLLLRELKQTGQPFAQEVFRDRISDPEEKEPKRGRYQRTTTTTSSMEEL